MPRAATSGIDRVCVFCAAMMLIVLTAAIALAQKPPPVTGDWTGALTVGNGSLRLALHVKADAAGKLSVTLDSLDQHAMGLAGSNAALKGKTFSFKIPSVSGTYTGTLADDGDSISGTWSQGVPLPLDFSRFSGGPLPTAKLAPTPAPAKPAVEFDHLKPALDGELEPVLRDGVLSKASGGGGLVIGVMDHGKRQIFAYGAAKADSIFEIGSITKTFTGLILAQMVVQKKVTLDEPIRSLLPAGFVAKPAGAEITLVDLATQHSGLPRMPDNFAPKDPGNPYADYGAAQLQEFFGKRGVAKPANAAFLYSNLGFGLLGYGLTQRAGLPYAQLLANEITGPLRLSDTVVTLSPAQRARLIQGFDGGFNPTGAWDLDVFASAGAIKSTASDMLTYLEANLHPEKYSSGASAGSPAATFSDAIVLDHKPRAEVGGTNKIALAWFFDPKTGAYNHNGGTGGYSSFAEFDPPQDRAVVVLYNRDNTDPAAARFSDLVGENIVQLMSGKPSLPIDSISEDERLALTPATFTDSSVEGAYHCTMTALQLPATIKDSFKAAATGDIYVVADGKGNFTRGTWSHHIEAPGYDVPCNLKMVSGSYAIARDGTGTEKFSWKLNPGEPRGCDPFLHPRGRRSRPTSRSS